MLHILSDLKSQTREFLNNPEEYYFEENAKDSTQENNEETFEDVLHISKKEFVEVIREVCIKFSDYHKEKTDKESLFNHDVNLFFNKTNIHDNKHFKICDKILNLSKYQNVYSAYIEFTNASCQALYRVVIVTDDELVLYFEKTGKKFAKWFDLAYDYENVSKCLYGDAHTTSLIFAIFKAIWEKERIYRNNFIFPEELVIQKNKIKNSINIALTQFAQSEKKLEFHFKDDIINSENPLDFDFTLKRYCELGLSPSEELLCLIDHGILEETKSPRRIAITDTSIHWQNGGETIYCDWEDFINYEVSVKFGGTVLWNGYTLFTADIFEKSRGNRIKNLLDMIINKLKHTL